MVEIYNRNYSKRLQSWTHGPTYFMSLCVHTGGRFLYSLQITGGVYNYREDHIFLSHINLHIVNRQDSFT